ncbi:hypothetical protein SEVIR_9G365100v4 [Setaria viridis]|uniref:Uncharacterized protein n=1 Tax=Setaria viridis TaxID=4556 RepID=A0A4U6T1U3_SETVI|nr:uncharacterized protein LOC117837270 [Setaria viridis]TKV95470.1 hypothetical protein SEVIR_9G365100v2 [Setaria viridis]
MDDVWPWLASLPAPPPAAEPDAPPPPPPWSLQLASSPDGPSIVLQADAATTVDGDDGSEPAPLVAFSLAINGAGAASALWTSDGFAVSSPVPVRLQLLVQLLNDVLDRSPYVPCLGANAVEFAGVDASSEARVDAEVVSAVMGAAGTDAFAAFFSLALLLRLFWLCALDAPADAGYLFFRDLGAGIERALGACRPALAAFLCFVGPDVEERFMRSLGYMLAKWCLLREMQAATGSAAKAEVPRRRRALPAACLSYAAEAHGLWVLKGYAPVLAMARVTAAASTSITASPHEVPEEPALRYGLVHQQLEAVVQLEYAVRVRDGRFLAVSVRVDNVRVRVARLAFRKDDEDAGGGATDDDAEDAGDDVMDGERHFPSRIRLWVGPRFGASYATGPSLGRSTGNPERDVEMTRTIKGAFSGATKLANGNVNAPRMKAKMRSSARTRSRSWRWEQEAEGSAGLFEGVLYDPVTGTEVSAWRPGTGGSRAADPRNGMRRRYGGPGRAFSKMRGLVVAGDELPEEMTWRVGREEEGRTLRWRLGLKAWVSYLPNEVRSRHFETRCAEWAHEVELPLVPINGDES